MQDISKLSVNAAKHHFEKTNEIKEETKKKLEALGIDPSTVTSEADARMKIQEAQAAQAAAIITEADGVKANPIQQVFSDARDLAERIGVKTGSEQNLQSLFADINKKITSFERGAEFNIKDEETTVSDLRNEFKDLYATYATAKQAQARITGDMGLIAEYNKMNASVNSSKTVSKKQIQELENAQAYRGRNAKFEEDDMHVGQTMQNQIGDNVKSQDGFNNKFGNNVQEEQQNEKSANNQSAPSPTEEQNVNNKFGFGVFSQRKDG